MNQQSTRAFDQQRRVYGRNIGVRLRPGQKKLMQELLPKLKYELEQSATIEPYRLFGQMSDVWLEIGFGGGEHLAELAKTHPGTGFLGVEPFVGGVAKLLAQVQKNQLGNVRIVIDDARLVLSQLSDQSIGRAFVLFPDPWPKKRHRKRRIVNPQTVDALARVLKNDSELRLATDDPDYARSMLEIMIGDARFAWLAECAEDWRIRGDDWPATRYEIKALDAGRRPLFLRFRRRRR